MTASDKHLRSDHSQSLGILHLVYAGLTLISGAVAFVSLFAESPSFWAHWMGLSPDSWNTFARLRIVLGSIVFLYAIVSVVLSLAAGLGFLNKWRCPRTVQIAAAFFALPIFPVGTATAVLTFWLVLTPQVHHTEQVSQYSAADTFR